MNTYGYGFQKLLKNCSKSAQKLLRIKKTAHFLSRHGEGSSDPVQISFAAPLSRK
jgi:hypothetical protein